MANPGLTVQGSGTAEIVLHPADYYDDPNLKLSWVSDKVFSIDEAGGKLRKTKANVPLQYVKSLQADLITIGYLKKVKDPKQALDNGLYSPKTKRAVLRFQRHARRVYRITRPANPKSVQEDEIDDVEPGDVFSGAVNGVCDQATAQEIRKWVDNDWVSPIGRFGLRLLKVPGVKSQHKLRKDAADAWEEIVGLVTAAGGILDAKSNGYGDTVRARQKSVAANKVGASSFSFHFSGRAVDIDQGYGGGLHRRYYMGHDLVSGRHFWRLYCKTTLQDGTQGTKFEKGAVKYMSSLINLESASVPEGWYIDMTALIESTGTFRRIPAQGGFDDKKRTNADRSNKTEWWHFQYAVDVQATFQDEMELIGATEDELRAAGWATDAELDHAPG